MHPDTEADIVHILQHSRTVAVVGFRPRPTATATRWPEYMQHQGWRIVPVNPVAAASGQPILGERVYATLTEASAAQKIDLVDVVWQQRRRAAHRRRSHCYRCSGGLAAAGIVNDAAVARPARPVCAPCRTAACWQSTVSTPDSISKSFVPRREAADSARARQDEATTTRVI